MGKWGGREMYTWGSNLAHLSGDGEDAKQGKIKGFYSSQEFDNGSDFRDVTNHSHLATKPVFCGFRFTHL